MIVSSTFPAIHKRAVIMSGDKNVVPYAKFIAAQIGLAEPERDFDICFCTPDKEIKFDHPALPDVRVCLVDTVELRSIPTKAEIPKPAHYKLALPNWFEQSYDQIIYLDTDVFLRKGRISDLFAAAQKGRAVSAVLDITMWNYKPSAIDKTSMDSFIKLGFLRTKYLNAGVLVFDVKSYCEEKILERAVEFARQFSADFSNTDQDALNGALQGDWAPLPLEWNWMTIPYTSCIIDQADPKILHFISNSKPYLTSTVSWSKRYKKQYADKYFEFFGETVPTYSFQNNAEIIQRLTVQSVVSTLNQVNPVFFLRQLIERIWYSTRLLRHTKKIDAAIKNGVKIWPPAALFAGERENDNKSLF